LKAIHHLAAFVFAAAALSAHAAPPGVELTAFDPTKHMVVTCKDWRQMKDAGMGDELAGWTECQEQAGKEPPAGVRAVSNEQLELVWARLPASTRQNLEKNTQRLDSLEGGAILLRLKQVLKAEATVTARAGYREEQVGRIARGRKQINDDEVLLSCRDFAHLADWDGIVWFDNLGRCLHTDIRTYFHSQKKLDDTFQELEAAGLVSPSQARQGRDVLMQNARDNAKTFQDARAGKT
jgi:hypothetical protein